MPIEQPATFRRYRAPQEDGQTLFEPSWSELPAVATANRQQLAAATRLEIQGRTLTDLSLGARRRLLEQSIAYTGQYRDLSESISNLKSRLRFGIQGPPAPIILSGHQPQLYHAGVWYKNFVLGALAQRVHGVGIHLLIDSDLCRAVSIRVPTVGPASPRLETVPYDSHAAEIPYEERAIRDRDIFQRFASRVDAAIASFVKEPLVQTLWPLVLERSQEESNLGLCLAQGRHLVEVGLGNDTLELPQSAVCQLPEFAWFVAHLLANLPRFRSAHNAALASYRAAHRIRNRAQPVPDLASAADGWQEAPLWTWTADDPTRRALFARRRAEEIQISDRNAHTIALSLSDDGDATKAVEQLLDLAGRGIKIRTRALTTTMFARLVLGDLFLHGIGGAKYDQVTNNIARDFFGIDLPQFGVVSATLRLPFQEAARHDFDPTLPQRLRDLRYHPERFITNQKQLSVDGVSKVPDIIATKSRWINMAKTPDNARDRHRAIHEANQALQPFVAETRQKLEQEIERQEVERSTSALFGSREYSFCLHPPRYVKSSLLDGLLPSS
jgi:hypothetical protein